MVIALVRGDFFICPDNTCHLAYELVAARSPIPWLSIAEVVAAEAKQRGYRRLALLGTRFTMDGPVYPTALARDGIECVSPNEAERAEIDRVIFQELVKSVCTEDARRYFNGVIERMGGGRSGRSQEPGVGSRGNPKQEGEGCDAAILGCTEIPLLVRPDDCPLPVLDSTRLLARAALSKAVAGSR